MYGQQMVVANDTVSVKVIYKSSINKVTIVTVYTMMVWGKNVYLCLNISKITSMQVRDKRNSSFPNSRIVRLLTSTLLSIVTTISSRVVDTDRSCCKSVFNDVMW